MAKKNEVGPEPVIVSKGDDVLPDFSDFPRVAFKHRTVNLSPDEVDVLRVLLDRQRTSEIVHGGLKSLLQLTDEQAATLLAFLKRI